MNKMKVKVIAGVLLVFLLGVIIGVLGTGIYVRHRIRQFAEGGSSGLRTVFMRKLTRELKLTETQKPQIEKIFDETEIEMRKLLRDSHAEFANIMQRRHAQLKEILTLEQQRQLDEIFAQIQNRWQKRGFFHNN